MEQNTPNQPVFLAMKAICKSFAGVKAVDTVDLQVESGKVLGLVGANGAGKSTLIKILAGAQQQDSGEILVEGQRVEIPDPRASTNLGLGFIHQELSLVADFNAVENITLGMTKDSNLGLINWNKTNQKVSKVLEQIHFQASPQIPVKELSIADQWLVAIARALFLNAKMIAMDEPTASLSESEVEMLFQVIRDLTRQGIAVIYVSHRLDEILEICDNITVMKDGKKVLDTTAEAMSKQDLIDVIAGRHVTAGQSVRREFDQVLLEVEQVGDEAKVKEVSLRLHKGEVLGISGLAGAGRTELGNLIFGASKLKHGGMRMDGKPYQPRTPAKAVNNGVVLIPEDRLTEGLVLGKSISFNVNLPNTRLMRLQSKLPLIHPRRGDTIAKNIVEKLRIKATGATADIQSLSGGNQQKVVIGKWLPGTPRLVIMDEPTRGVDVGARAEIYDIIRRMSEEGTSFLIISSDVEELPGLCDNVLVMVEGYLSGSLAGEEITKENILKLSYAAPLTGPNGGNKQPPAISAS